MVKDEPVMTITPFLTLKIRGKKDAVLARQRARRVAGLLAYDPYEQACIAAGAFVIACQSLMLFGKARLCFQIGNQQLQIFALEAKSEGEEPAPVPIRLTGLLPELDPKSLLRLVKPLPLQEHAAEELDLGWLVRKLEETACSGMFDEIVRQNQEVLALLHEVRLCQASLSEKEKNLPNPHAA